MKTWNRYLILFVLFGLLFSFCHKKDKNTEPIDNSSIQTTSSNPTKPYRTVYVSNSLKGWGMFNVGSYWIYRDSLTAILDSVYVSSIDTTYTKQFYKSDSDIVIEKIHVKVKGSLLDYYNLKSDDIIYYNPNPNFAYDVPCFALDTSFYNANLPQFPQVNSTISSLTIFGNQYLGVRHFRTTNYFQMHSSGLFYISESHYWKKNIGIVKIRHYDLMGSSWGDGYRCKELVRYNVIQ